MAAKSLCESDLPLEPGVLIKLAGKPMENAPNCHVLRKMLKQGEPAAVGIFGRLLAEPDVYYEFREAMSPAIVGSLRTALATLDNEPRCHAMILIIGQSPDPIGGLTKLLEDPAWPAKGMVACELGRLGDPRSLEPLGRCLRLAKDGHFRTEFGSGSEPCPGRPISSCIDAISQLRGEEATGELIRLMSVGFGRQNSDYPNDEDLNASIAVVLTNRTGALVGFDAVAWSNWYAERKAGKRGNPNP